MLDIKDRIRDVRVISNLSQSEFAEKIGIKQASVSAIEKGIRGITDRVISDICREFNVNEDWLRTGAGEMFKSEGEFLELIASELDNLDDLDKKFISEYIKLPPPHRQNIKEFIKKMAT